MFLSIFSPIKLGPLECPLVWCFPSSDYEYDSDEEEDFDQLPPGGVNETLTKKKYCQSSKLFNQVFDSVKQFEAFQRSVSKMKKYVFSIIFALFLDSLPTETRFRIPQELWEKVWKFTQNSYFRYKDSVPLHKDSSYYKAGLRAAEPALALLEKERVRELFAAVGNLHMIIFEILFKNPLILQPNPMFELECGEGAQERLGRGVLRAAIQAARTKFSRLQHLEGVLGEGDAPTQAPSLDLHQKIGSGAVLVRDVELQLDPLPSSVAKLDPPSSVIVSSSVCSKFAVTGRYALTEGGEEFGLLLVVVSAVTGAVVQVVRTGHSYQSHLIEVGACGVRRKGGAGWKNHFCITEDRLSFLTRTVDSQGDGVSVWTCALPALPSDQPVTLTAPLVRTVSRPQHPAPTLRHSAGAALGHTTTALLLLSQSPFSPGPLTSLSLYSLDQGELLLEVPWPGQDLVLQGLTDSRVLLAADSAIHFFSLTAGEVVASYSHQQLGQGEAWAGVMDASPGLRQFAIYTPTLSAFRLYRWEEKEMAAPCLVLESGGPLAEAVEGLGPTVRLLAGVLVTNRSRELATSSPQAMEEGRGGLQCHEVTAYSLASAARHQLLAMGADREAALRQEPLLNQLEPRWWDEPVRESEVMKMLEGRRQLWNPERRPVFLITASLAGVLLESGDLVRTLDMSLGPGEVARREAEDLLQGGAGQAEVARHLQGGTSTMEE